MCRYGNGNVGVPMAEFLNNYRTDRPQISETSHLRNFAPHNSFDNSEFFVLKSR